MSNISLGYARNVHRTDYGFWSQFGLLKDNPYLIIVNTPWVVPKLCKQITIIYPFKGVKNWKLKIRTTTVAFSQPQSRGGAGSISINWWIHWNTKLVRWKGDYYSQIAFSKNCFFRCFDDFIQFNHVLFWSNVMWQKFVLPKYLYAARTYNVFQKHAVHSVCTVCMLNTYSSVHLL